MMTTEATTLFDEVLDFLASTPTPEQVIAFQPSETLQSRMSDLIDRNHRGHLTAAEQAELEECSRLNHFMSMLKVRVRNRLAG